MPSKSVSSTSYEVWTGKKPNLNNLRPWGSIGYVHNTSHRYGKLVPRGKKCIFIRYYEHSKGYVLIGEQLDGSVTELESRDVDFIESEFPNIGEVEKNLTLYEMMDQVRGAPMIHNNLSHVEVTVVMFLVIVLRLKGKLS